MHDQASRLRSLMRRSAWPADNTGSELPRIITFAGGSRGVGATTIATNVAAAVAQQGWRTVLIDGDRMSPRVADCFSVSPQATLADVLLERCSVHEALLSAGAGLHVLGGVKPEDADRITEGKGLAGLLAALTRHADIVMIDAGSATDAWAQTLWSDAERVVMVTGADSVAIMESYAALKTVWRQGMGAAVQVLVNRTADAATAADVHARLDRSCRRFLGFALEPGAAIPENDALVAPPANAMSLGGCHPPPLGPLFERLAESLVNPAVALSRRPAA